MFDYKIKIFNQFDIRKDWFEFCSIAFCGDLSMKDYFSTSWLTDPYLKDNIVLIIQDGNNNILSSVSILKRKMKIFDKELRVGGIATVCTKSEYKRKGLAGKLINEALLLMKNRDDDISLLGTGIPEYYNKFGWKSIMSNRIKLNLKSLDNHQKYKIHISNNPQWDKINTVYNAEMTKNKRNGMIVREPTRDWQKWLYSKQCTWCICEDGTRIRSYCAAIIKDDIIDINEFGYLEGCEEDLANIISHLDIKDNYKIICCDGVLCSYKAQLIKLNGLMMNLLHPITINSKKFSVTEDLIKYLELSEIPFSFSEIDSF